MPGKRKASGYGGVSKYAKGPKGRMTVRTIGAMARAPGATRGYYGAKSRLARQLQGIFEKKVIETAPAGYACDTTGTVTLLNGCAQGSDFTMRIGRKFTNVAVQLEGIIQPVDNNTQLTGGKARVLLLYDSQPNGTLPAITDIFVTSSSLSFMNLNNRDRFKVICDENVSLGGISDTATQAVAGSPTVYNVSVFKKINYETVCDGTTDDIADINSGSLLLVTIGSSAAGTCFTFTGAARVRFYDA